MTQIIVEYVVCYVPDNVQIFLYNAKVACSITEVRDEKVVCKIYVVVYSFLDVDHQKNDEKFTHVQFNQFNFYEFSVLSKYFIYI